MNNKLLINLLANFAPNEIGQSIVDENQNLSVYNGLDTKMVLGGAVGAGNALDMFVGGIRVQGGYIETSDLNFTITYPTAFDDDNVVIVLTEAGTNTNAAQVDYQSASKTSFDVLVTAGSGAEAYYWVAIGNR